MRSFNPTLHCICELANDINDEGEIVGFASIRHKYDWRPTMSFFGSSGVRSRQPSQSRSRPADSNLRQTMIVSSAERMLRRQRAGTLLAVSSSEAGRR